MFPLRRHWQYTNNFIPDFIDMKIFMDDARDTPEGYHRAYDIEETKRLLSTRQVTFISLDNDLGSLDPKTEGYNILNWMEEIVHFDPSFPIPEIIIHSSNASRAQSMRQVAEKLELLRQQQLITKE
jgi:hypothetical protein